MPADAYAVCPAALLLAFGAGWLVVAADWLAWAHWRKGRERRKPISRGEMNTIGRWSR